MRKKLSDDIVKENNTNDFANSGLYSDTKEYHISFFIIILLYY